MTPGPFGIHRPETRLKLVLVLNHVIFLQQSFDRIQGQDILLRHLNLDTSTKLVVKILSFVADILSVNDTQQMFDDNWCGHLLTENVLSKDDLDHVEKFVHCLVNFKTICRNEMAENVGLRKWISNARQVVRQNQESESDFEKTLSGIAELVTVLNLTRTEL